MLGVFAEFEANLRRERQLEGIAAAKSRGVYRGRKPSIDGDEIQRLYNAYIMMKSLGRLRLHGNWALAALRYTELWLAMEKKRKNVIPNDSLLQLRNRLDSLPPKSPERADQINKMEELYAVSTTTVYRALKDFRKLRSAHRFDNGKSRIMPQADVERYCELIAAFNLRTTNKHGRHISTARIIEIMEDHGIETSRGLVKIPKGLLSRSTVDRYLAQLKLNQSRLLRESPAVRFQAEHGNDCWQFDMSHSDLKHIDKPEWVNPNKGEPTFNVVQCCR